MLIQLCVWDYYLGSQPSILSLMPWAWHMSVMAAKCPGVGWSISLREKLQPWAVQPNCWYGDTETSGNRIWWIWENHAWEQLPCVSSCLVLHGYLTGELCDHLNYRDHFCDTAVISINVYGFHFISAINYSMHYLSDAAD